MNVPEASPLTVWNARTKDRFGENGRRRDEIMKMTHEITSTRRTPNVMPSQGEVGVISICPTVKAVVIQAPSSKPAWTAPRTSARPKLVRRASSVEMTVPKSTASTPIRGRLEMIGCGRHASRSAGR